MKTPTFFAAFFVALFSLSCKDDRCVKDDTSHFLCKHPYQLLAGAWKANLLTIDGEDSTALIVDKPIGKRFVLANVDQSTSGGTKPMLIAHIKDCCCTYGGSGFPPYFSEENLKRFDIRCEHPPLFSTVHIGFSAKVVSKNEIHLTQKDKIKRNIFIRLIRI